MLAVRIRREGFEWALANSALSGYDSGAHGSREEWKRAMRRSPVRVQWDPERDLALRPLQWRSLQVGLRGEAVRRYVDEWIVGIEDVTATGHEVRALVRQGLMAQAARLLPAEQPYPLGGALADRIGASRGRLA